MNEFDAVRALPVTSSRAPRIQTEARAKTIAGLLSATSVFAGIDTTATISILMRLIPMLVDCFRPDDGQQEKEYVEKRWKKKPDDQYAGYDKRLLKAMTRRVKEAASQNRMIITWDQANALAIETLDNIRLSNPQSISLVIRENDFVLI